MVGTHMLKNKNYYLPLEIHHFLPFMVCIAVAKRMELSLQELAIGLLHGILEVKEMQK
jgi:hypothetical protein